MWGGGVIGVPKCFLLVLIIFGPMRSGVGGCGCGGALRGWGGGGGISARQGAVSSVGAVAPLPCACVAGRGGVVSSVRVVSSVESWCHQTAHDPKARHSVDDRRHPRGVCHKLCHRCRRTVRDDYAGQF